MSQSGNIFIVKLRLNPEEDTVISLKLIDFKYSNCCLKNDSLMNMHSQVTECLYYFKARSFTQEFLQSVKISPGGKRTEKCSTASLSKTFNPNWSMDRNCFTKIMIDTFAREEKYKLHDIPIFSYFLNI